MPKVIGTRKQMAEELLERLKRGPSFYSWQTPEKNYHLWVRSWIIPDVKKLIPELREKGGGR